MSQFGLTKEETQIVLASQSRLAEAYKILCYVASQPKGATCDECCIALEIRINSGSTQVSKLVRAGCLSYSGSTRKTSSGGVAKVCKVEPGADFHRLLLKKKLAGPSNLPESDRVILAAGRKFVSQWKRAKSRGRQAQLVKELVSSLSGV